MAGEDHHVQDQPLPDDQAVDQLRRRQRDQESSGRVVRVHRPQLWGQDDGTGPFENEYLLLKNYEALKHNFHFIGAV